MSRNKDKYEVGARRRDHTYMSPDDVAAGKKAIWQAVEITGTHMRALFFPNT